MVEKLWRYVKPFSYNTSVSRTDRQTDRRTDGRTELLYQYRASAAVYWRAIKTVLISCNWTDQLLFTYKMALFISHNHSFVYGWSILIKFTHLTDIYLDINWWKIQQNMSRHFRAILVLSGDCFCCNWYIHIYKYTQVRWQVVIEVLNISCWIRYMW